MVFSCCTFVALLVISYKHIKIDYYKCLYYLSGRSVVYMPTVNELNERLSSTLSLHDKMSLISSYVLDYDEKI